MKKVVRRRGFTIIEVSLVLSIAGLIFLMVFVALPALQRNQRDAQRREDVMTYLEQLNRYTTNNRGALPTNWGSFMDTYFNKGHSDPSGGDKYGYEVVDCGASVGLDERCTAKEIDALHASDFPYKDYTFLIVKQATCDEDVPIKTASPRTVAILYRLEGGGVYCDNL